MVTNRTKENARGGSVFIPVPKAGRDFGPVFNPDGAWAFDMRFTLQGSVPDGWAVSYLKMKEGISYDARTAPKDGDYSVVADLAEADMIMLDREGEIPDGAGYEFVFDVVAPDMDKLKPSSSDSLVNTWNCTTRYTIGTTTVVPPASRFSASVSLHPGTVTGLVYEDLNDNGVQDPDEMSLGGAEVPRDGIALSDVSSAFEMQLTFPAGVKPPTDPMAYAFKSLSGTDFAGGAASGMYVAKGAARVSPQADGTTRVAVSFELADPAAYGTYAKLHDAAFAEPAYLTLVVSGVDVSTAHEGKDLAVVGTVGGSVSAKAVVLCQERDFAFNWEAVQDKDVAAIGDGTDAVPDQTSQTIQLTLQVGKAGDTAPDPAPDPIPTPEPGSSLTPDLRKTGDASVRPAVLPVTGDGSIALAVALFALAASGAALAVRRMRRTR